MYKLRIWFLAHFRNKPFWVVDCNSGVKIMFLRKKDAKIAKKLYNGKMRIYYKNVK